MVNASTWDPKVGFPENNISYVDDNVSKILKSLPSSPTVTSISSYGELLRNRTAKVQTTGREGSTVSYFLTICEGDHGKGMMPAEFCSMSALHDKNSNLVPQPLGWGTYKKKPDVYFFLCSFHKMTGKIPDDSKLPAMVAKMHKSGISDKGKFGCPFKSQSGRPVTTYQGRLPQHDGVYDTWEEYFSADIQHFFKLEEASQGPDDEMVKLGKGIVKRVIPRLLRPLKGKIDPTLVHGDLREGNVSIDEATQLPIIFNASCLYAHNEYELAPWRYKPYKSNHSYIKNYYNSNVIRKSEPIADFDDRNALYGVRFNLCRSAMQPGDDSLRNIIKEEMDELVKKFPDGYEGYMRDMLPGTS